MTVDEILGVVDGVARNVTGVRLKNVKSGVLSEIPADGVFIAIGHAPSSELFAGQLEINSGGYLRVKPGTASTAIEGVYAAGDVTDDVYRQAVTAAGMAGMAALEAARSPRKTTRPPTPHQPQGSREDRRLVGLASPSSRPGGWATAAVAPTATSDR